MARATSSCDGPISAQDLQAFSDVSLFTRDARHNSEHLEGSVRNFVCEAASSVLVPSSSIPLMRGHERVALPKRRCRDKVIVLAG